MKKSQGNMKFDPQHANMRIIVLIAALIRTRKVLQEPLPCVPTVPQLNHGSLVKKVMWLRERARARHRQGGGRLISQVMSSDL